MSFIPCASDCRHQEDGCCGLTKVPAVMSAGTGGDCKRGKKRDVSELAE